MSENAKYPTPWKMSGRTGDDYETIHAANGNTVVSEVEYDLGLEIVTAVNLHAVLLESHRELVKALGMMLAQGGPLGSYGDAAFATARAALKKAEEFK